ncbi:MAG: type III secretion system cytoplasmic ring protein SctQ [Candidatus Accumulibacter sp.]|nr:type III secretion system cytoplasmic ring protein SctQ [Accumulibacter sp.]
MERSPPLAPYRPPALTPDMARLCDALASRAALAAENAAFPLSFHFEPDAAPLAEQAVLTFEAGGFPWRLEFYDLDFLASNPALVGVEIGRLPEPLVRAALLLALQAFLDRLENALRAPVNPEDETKRPPEARNWLDPVLRFTLDFTGEAPARETPRHWRIPIGLRASSREGAAWLADRVRETLPESRRYPRRMSLLLEVRLEAASMRVPASLLQNLAVADILIPPDYPARDGRLILRLPDGSGFGLALSDGRATLIDFSHHVYAKEMDVNPPDPPGGKPALAALEVPISFELERKLLPLATIESLAPGSVFPLGADPLSVVTVTLNGQALAAGRLVDLGGVLGVQITRLMQAPETS